MSNIKYKIFELMQKLLNVFQLNIKYGTKINFKLFSNVLIYVFVYLYWPNVVGLNSFQIVSYYWLLPTFKIFKYTIFHFV